METRSSPGNAALAVAPKDPLTMGARGVQLRSLEDLQRLANMVVASNLAPKGDTPAAVAVKIQLGLELGLPPMASLNRIAVINGRPSIFGDAGKALVLGSGLQDGAPRVEWSGKPDSDDWTCDVWLRRKGMVGEFHGSFSVRQAKRARLWGKAGPWTEHPDRQMEWRAWWYAAREGFADVLGGIASAEESLDLMPEPPREVVPEVKPKGLDGLTAKMQERPKGGLVHIETPAESMALDAADPVEQHGRAVAQAVAEQMERAERLQQRGAAHTLGASSAFTAGLSRAETADPITGEVVEPEPEPAPEPEAPGPMRSEAIHTWWADEETELEVAFDCSRAGGYFERWADEPVPQSKLSERAKTWRAAAEGAEEGGRFNILRSAVQKGVKALLEGQGITIAHQRAACCLALIRHKARQTPQEPQGEPSLPGFE